MAQDSACHLFKALLVPSGNHTGDLWGKNHIPFPFSYSLGPPSFTRWAEPLRRFWTVILTRGSSCKWLFVPFAESAVVYLAEGATFPAGIFPFNIYVVITCFYLCKLWLKSNMSALDFSRGWIQNPEKSHLFFTLLQFFSEIIMPPASVNPSSSPFLVSEFWLEPRVEPGWNSSVFNRTVHNFWQRERNKMCGAVSWTELETGPVFVCKWVGCGTRTLWPGSLTDNWAEHVNEVDQCKVKFPLARAKECSHCGGAAAAWGSVLCGVSH